MSDLNKKNINYGALNRFYQDLKSHDLSDLNDKIDNIDVPEYNAGEGIAIDSANTISCTVKPIADVNALPDAEANKDSVLRLEGDEQVYISKNIQIPPKTVNAPEAQQINSANIEYSNVQWMYTGEETSITINNQTITVYGWENGGSTDVYSSNKASEIYFDENNGEFITDTNFYYGNVNPEQINISGITDMFVVKVKAPIEEQVGNASYVWQHSRGGGQYDYPTAIYGVNEGQILEEPVLEIQCTDGILPIYKWDDGWGDYNYTLKSPSEISYYVEAISQASLEDLFGIYDKPYIYSGTKAVFITNFNNASKIAGYRDGDYYILPHITGQILYEVTNEWQWKYVVTEDEIVPEIGENESTFTGATLTVDGSQPSIVASGSTTIVWDDLASSIPSGKSVEVSVVLINTGNSALTPTMSGNYQMMGDGNLTIQAGELGLYRGRYISALNKWLIEAIYQEVSGTME